MTIKLLAIGQTDGKELNRLIADYGQRLGHYVKFDFHCLPDVKRGKKISAAQQKEKEEAWVLKELAPHDLLFLFDEKGKELSSFGFAGFLQKQMNMGPKRLVFLIGGPYGFSEGLYQKAQGKISLSKMTFSHQMVRLFAVEQMYRAFTILNNHPYHHQ